MLGALGRGASWPERGGSSVDGPPTTQGTHIFELFEATFQLLLSPPSLLEVLWKGGREGSPGFRQVPSARPREGGLTIFLSCFISCEYLTSSRHTRTLRFSATSSRWPAKSFTSCRICTKDCCWLNLGWGKAGTQVLHRAGYPR